MLVHKLYSPTGAVIAAGFLIIAATFIAKRDSTSYHVGVKGNRLEVVPSAGCSQVVWPYGCNWQLDELPDTTRNSRLNRRKQRHLDLRWFLS
jgi:hypothetical protein